MSEPDMRAEHTTRPAITLAVPYYSGFELTLRTLSSIGAQSYQDVHVLLCDDSPNGLTASEQSELQSALGPARPLRILRNERNLGMARTWNRCLDEAATDLVTIVHGDDELDPSYASEMARIAAVHPDACALFSGARVIGDDGRDVFSFPDKYKSWLIPRHDDALVLRGDSALHSLLRGNYIYCPSLCYRRSRLGRVRFDPSYRMVLDMDLTTRLLLAGESIVGLPKRQLYRYRRHDDNATERLTKDLTRFREESEFYLDIAQRARGLGFERSERTARRRRIVALNLLFCIVRDIRGRQWADGRRKLALFRTLFLAV